MDLNLVRIKLAKLYGVHVSEIQRVTITDGAWKGEQGFVVGAPLENDAYPIVLDSGISLAWYKTEFEFQ